MSERIARIRVKLHLSFATIIAVYAPTNPTSSTSKAMSPSMEFHSLLQSVIVSVPCKDMLNVLGDFNARISQSCPHWKSIVGPFTPNDTNENVSLLLGFCASNHLFIANAWFQHKPILLTTWYHKGDCSRTEHTLDYVLVNHNFKTSVLDTRVYHSMYLEFNHELVVVSTLHYKIRAKRRQPKHGSHYLPLDSVRAYELVLSSSLHLIQQGGDQPDDVEHIWTMFKSAIREASQSLPVLPNKRPIEWMTEELLNLSHKKQDAWMRLQNKDHKSDDPTLKLEYKRLCKLTKFAAENTRNVWWSERAAEAEKRAWFAEQLGQGGSLVKELHLLGRQVSKPVATPLLAKDSSSITSDGGKLRRWAEHFKEVVNCDSVVSEAVLDTLPVVAW